MEKIVLLSFILLLCCGRVTAQTFENDTSFIKKAEANATQRYAQSIKGQSQLYNGSDYAHYNPLEDEHPYFVSDDWIMGSIYYDGNFYNNVALQYDISKDELLTEHYYGGSMLNLVKNKITSFMLGDNKFVHLQDSLHNGFYQLLYDGKTKVYARHTKALQETLSSSEIHRAFEEKTKYFLYKKRSYYHVKSKGSVLNVFGDKKKELNQFISKNKIKFKKSREQSIIKLAQFYDRS